MLYKKLEEAARVMREELAGMVGDGPAQHRIKLLAGEFDSLAVEAAVLQPEVPENG